jgi:hypothetical protein
MALSTLGLAAFLEYLHELIGGRQDYIKIALDHLAAMFTIASAFVDLQATYGKKRVLLNMKVSLGLSVVSAVWCLKSVDNGMFPFYKEDLRLYRLLLCKDLLYRVFQKRLASTSPTLLYNSTEYIITIVHGVLLAAFAILFMLCVVTAILAGCCLQRETPYHSTRQLTNEAVVQSRLASINL